MKVDGAVHLAGILTAPYLKNQICNFAIRYDCVNLVMFALVNGATVVPKSMSETRGFMGLKTLKLLHSITDATQMDAFLQRAIFIPIALTDAEITAILQGTQAGYEFPNLVPLFSDSKWVKHAEATPSADGKTLTLAATAGGKLSYVRIPVFSNTKYEFSFNHTTTDGWAWIDEKYGTITTKSFASTSTFTTSPNTTSVVLSLSNNAAGTIAFSNVSLKIKM
jgi:hypothetical protein